MAAAAIGEIILDLGPRVPVNYWNDSSRILEAALDDKDPRVRRSAAYALGAFGRLASPAAASLRKLLADKQPPAVRQNAAWALGRIGDTQSTTVAKLCDLLRDSNALVRRDAAGALERLGLKGGRKAVSRAAEPLLNLVKGERDEVVRKTALGALASLSGPEHEKYAPDLYPLLDSKDDDTRRGAAYVLGNMGGKPAQRAMPELKKALAVPDPTVQSLAAACLANAGDAAVKAVDELARLLTKSKDPTVRRNCCVALAHLGPKAKPALDALATAMQGSSSTQAEDEVREYAAEAIAQMRYPQNEGAMAVIRKTIAKDKNRLVRQRCVWAIFNVQDLDKYDLTKTLTDVLDETDDDSLLVRYDSARVLAHVLKDKAPNKTVDTLLHMLANKTLRVFYKTDASIEGAGNEAGGGSSGVAADLGGDARYMAAEALGWLGEKASKNTKVVEALREAKKDSSKTLADEATKTWAKLKLDKD